MTIHRRPLHSTDADETVRMEPVADGDTVRVKPTSGRPTPRPVPMGTNPTKKLDQGAVDAVHEEGVLAHDAVMGNIGPVMTQARHDIAFAQFGEMMDDEPKPAYGIPRNQRSKHGHTPLQKPEPLEPR